MNRTLIYVILILGLFIFLAWYFSAIFIYIVLAIIISAILRPMTNRLSRGQIYRIRMPRILAVLVSFSIFFLVACLFVILFIPLISDQIRILTGLNYEELLEQVKTPIQRFEQFLFEYNLSSQEPGFIMESFRAFLSEQISSINFGDVVNQIISFTGNFFIGFLAVFFISFFLLYEMAPMRKKMITLIPNRYFEVSIVAFNKIEQLLSNYLLGLLFQMTAIFTLASVGLSIFGIKYALTIAIFAAVANLIPYLGPILGSVFGIIVGISTGTDLVTTNDYIFMIIKIVGVFSVVQVTDNIVLQPLIFSKSVKAHPLEIFIIIFAGATLAGIAGMIAAIPAYTIIRVISTEMYAGYKQYSVFNRKTS